MTCGDGGILGPVVGVMGVLMALEAIKIITAGTACAGGSVTHHATDEPLVPSMLIFSAFGSPPFRSIRLRGRKSNCAACSVNPSITLDSLRSGSLDYAQFCGLTNPITILSPEERIAPRHLEHYLRGDEHPIIIDVRDAVQFDLCHLESSINVPYSSIVSLDLAAANSDEEVAESEKATLETLSKRIQSYPEDAPLYFICRFGNDSQLAVQKIKELSHTIFANRVICDVQGGFQAWRREVDSTWPEY